MLLLLIFPILVAGFIACHIHPIHSYRLHRYEGQYLYLKSAELGLLCFFLVLILVAVLHIYPGEEEGGPGSIPLQITSYTASAISDLTGVQGASAQQLAWFAQLSILTSVATVVPALLSKLVLCVRYRSIRTRVYAIGEILEDSPLDDLLYRLSLDKTKYAMLTMDDRKVYVGKVIRLGEPSATKGMDQDVAIIPLMSGFRHKDHLSVEFKTFYADVNSDIYLCLRQQSIISATEFNFDAYKIWNPPKAKPAKEGATAPKPAAPKPTAPKPAATAPKPAAKGGGGKK